MNDLVSFSGAIYEYDLIGTLKSLAFYTNGKLISKLAGKELNVHAKKVNGKAPACGTWHYYNVRNYVDWYHRAGDNPYRYNFTQYVGTTVEWYYVQCNDMGAGFEGTMMAQKYLTHGTTRGSDYNTADGYYEEQIDNSAITGTKAGCVYEKMKDDNILKRYLEKFDGEFPTAHLRLEQRDLDDNVRARTSPPENYWITITLNNDGSSSSFNNRPVLSTAKTIIHEVIHAEMFRKLLSLANNNGAIDANDLRNKLAAGDYPGIFDYYTRYGVNGFQHPQMATHYRETIAGALKEFDNSQHSWQFYMDLAWEGLDHSNVPAWTALSSDERSRIKKVISDFVNSGSKTCSQ